MYRCVSLLALFALLALFSGCGPSLESKLVGRWKLDVSSIDVQKVADAEAKKQRPDDAMAAAMSQMAAAMLQEMFKNMKAETEFRADHTCRTTVEVAMLGQSQQESKQGTWKAEQVGDRKLNVTMALDEGEPAKTIAVEFLDDNTFSAAMPLEQMADQQVKFVRVTP